MTKLKTVSKPSEAEKDLDQLVAERREANRKKARDFLGIAEEDLASILSHYEPPEAAAEGDGGA